MAMPGIMMYFAMFFSYGLTGTSCLSESCTMLWQCAILVHIFIRTGVSNFSEISYASLVNSRASAESEGSSMGSLAAIA